MRNDYSLEELSEFVKSEAEELNRLGLSAASEAPAESTLQNILAFSKQLSVRASRTLGRYEQNLN